MLVSYVVRLVGWALDEGRVAGEVHNVGTGERTAVRSADELVAALLGGGRGSASRGAEAQEGHR